MTLTSSISGTFENRQRSPVRVAAASSFRAAFFAPLIGTCPDSGRPPSIRKISRSIGSGRNSQWNGRSLPTRLAAPPRALAVASLGDPDPQQGLLEGGPGGGQVGGLVVAGLERLLGLAPCLLGPLE